MPAFSFSRVAALWAPDAINNGRAVTIDEIRAQLEDLHRTFPDHGSTSVETTVAGDFVIVLQRTSGTHRGGARPLGRRFEVLRAHWWKFRDGKIVWHQVVSDDLAMMRQLGLIPDTLPPDSSPLTRTEPCARPPCCC